MSQSRRQDREKKKRERDRRQRERARHSLWEFNAAERERTTWPVERAWVPHRDAWPATGNGFVAVERRQPDGQFIGSFYIIDMMLEGLTMAVDVPDRRAGDFAKAIEECGAEVPAFEVGPVELASRFAWGAYALSVESGRDWAQVEGIKKTMAMMPKPPGTPGQWSDMLWNELTPPGLRRVLARSPHPSGIPENKETLIFTTATFDADDSPDDLAEKLRKAVPDFVDDGERDGEHFFSLTRPYPKKHWSPFASLGRRQVIGQLTFRSAAAGRSKLVITGKTLSMTGVLIHKTKRILGDAIRLVDTNWQDLDDFRAKIADDERG